MECVERPNRHAWVAGFEDGVRVHERRVEIAVGLANEKFQKNRGVEVHAASRAGAPD